MLPAAATVAHRKVKGRIVDRGTSDAHAPLPVKDVLVHKQSFSVYIGVFRRVFLSLYIFTGSSLDHQAPWKPDLLEKAGEWTCRDSFPF